MSKWIVKEGLGANLSGSACRFRVWAPNASEVELHLKAPVARRLPMTREAQGYYTAEAQDIAPGTRYTYQLNGQTELPDPASRSQPEGVHGASEIGDGEFRWCDSHWFGLPLRDYIIYELHVGTFSAEGTFDGVVNELPRLKDLGITAIEIMPVAQFPGTRNWGYDGVGLFAVQNSYGGPNGLKRMVEAAHREGIAVILDVVYNHVGPEGNYLDHFGPYFTDTYKTPWGRALNFDGPHSEGVRRFFIENALYWQTEFHLDALRLDAVHAIRDISASPFLRELSRATRARAEELNRRFYLIAETDLNAPRFILPEQQAGYGLDAQWADDFHHCLHVLLTGEKRGYYEDYTGGVAQFAKVWREGYAYTGEYSPFRKARHGDSTRLNSLKQFVVCLQNHDQVGNRMLGERISNLTDFESLKLGAGCVLLSPFIPLLFMGEEYGECAPFQYFIDHSDESLIEGVRQGRSEEFASFAWAGEIPDPKGEKTFHDSQLNLNLAEKGDQAALLHLYRELILLRRDYRCFSLAERHEIEVKCSEAGEFLIVHYRCDPELL
ncbi:MAG TPA: malto-oligosyltrehalose trehalohydrolase, partial [Verrucomicrobiae bacterium]|nr:malto-oligosyltrehalose trehalohydrolase [Verrucomicrobiae bacterium]